MGHAGDELAYDRESLGDDKLLREPLLLGNIFDDSEVKDLTICCIGNYANTQTGRHRPTRSTFQIAFNIKHLTMVGQLVYETNGGGLIDKKIL